MLKWFLMNFLLLVNLLHTELVTTVLIMTHISNMKHWNKNTQLDMEELPSIASNRCTTKPLSRLLTNRLTTVLVQCNEYCNGII